MEIIKHYSITKAYLDTGPGGTPLILCKETAKTKEAISSAGFATISLNSVFSKALLEYDPKDRPKVASEVLNKILAYHVPIYIKDFEMLFDPRYKIDPLKLFCEKARIIKVAVQWPGQFKNGNLVYAEQDDPEYREYDCNKYQIRIVQ